MSRNEIEEIVSENILGVALLCLPKEEDFKC